MIDGRKHARAPAEALLILGPTGSGKSPLGDLLEERGLRGRLCHHFDFGARLRRATDGTSRPSDLTDAEVEHVRSLLRRGALLEDDRFAIAETILRGFLLERNVESRDLVLLNGLPRHVGQARALEPLLRVSAVVCLEADAETIHRRIQTNAGGDRAGRTDDDRSQVQGRLDVYEARTLPLLEWYASSGARRHVVPIRAETSPEDALALLSRHCGP